MTELDLAESGLHNSMTVVAVDSPAMTSQAGVPELVAKG